MGVFLTSHLAMIFEIMVPFLKGFYLTLNSWQLGRDAEDWKVADKQWLQILADRFQNGLISAEELESSKGPIPVPGPPMPIEVKASPRLAGDVESLLAIFNSSEAPPLVNLRSRKVVTVIYGLGMRQVQDWDRHSHAGSDSRSELEFGGQTNTLNLQIGRNLLML